MKIMGCFCKVYIMSENHNKKEDMKLIGIIITLVIIFLIYTIIQQDYYTATFAILTFFFVIPIGGLYFHIVEQSNQENKLYLWLSFPFLIMLGFLTDYLSNYIIDKAFEHQPQTEFCGIFISEFTTGQGRSESLNWKIHNPRTKEELDFRKPNKPHLQVGHHLCVYYAIDKRWQSTPYIFHIEQK